MLLTSMMKTSMKLCLLRDKREELYCSISCFITFIQGESLFDFLERQVKGQMREALGQPLQNISQDLLNKVVSKDIQQSLKKYKMGMGKTPNKGNRGKSAEKGDYPSPQRRLQFGSSTVVGYGSPDRAAAADDFVEYQGGNSKEIREIIKELNSGIHDKVSLLKILIIKCTEADANYKKIKHFINKADPNNADK